jgi:hypothetical protein
VAFKLEHILYSIGGLFAASAIIYFAWEYLVLLPRIIKAVLLVCLLGAFYLLGNHFRERDV